MNSDCFIAFQVIDTTLILGIASVLILLLCSALISGAEVALFSLTQADLEASKEQGSKSIHIITQLLKRPKKLLATMVDHDSYIAQITPYNESPVTAIFETQGLKEVIDSFKDECYVDLS